MKKMIIMRGLPGSGKSTWIRKNYPDAVGATSYNVYKEKQIICSADHWFERTGEYVWNPDELSQAHGKCKFLAEQAMMSGAEVVIIDNTNVKPRDWKAHKKNAERLGYEIEFADLFDGGLTDEKLSARNTHGVQAHTIARMRSKWFQMDPRNKHPKKRK